MDLIKVSKQKGFRNTKIQFKIDDQTFVLDVDYKNKHQLEIYEKLLISAFNKYAALKIDDQFTVIDCKIKYSDNVDDLIKLSQELIQFTYKISNKILEITNNES